MPSLPTRFVTFVLRTPAAWVYPSDMNTNTITAPAHRILTATERALAEETFSARHPELDSREVAALATSMAIRMMAERLCVLADACGIDVDALPRWVDLEVFGAVREALGFPVFRHVVIPAAWELIGSGALDDFGAAA